MKEKDRKKQKWYTLILKVTFSGAFCFIVFVMIVYLKRTLKLLVCNTDSMSSSSGSWFGQIPELH